ncbi:MAG: hypothetical protein ACOYMB_04500 [Patescibacteria group bacterium]
MKSKDDKITRELKEKIEELIGNYRAEVSSLLSEPNCSSKDKDGDES